MLGWTHKTITETFLFIIRTMILLYFHFFFFLCNRGIETVGGGHSEACEPLQFMQIVSFFFFFNVRVYEYVKYSFDNLIDNLIVINCKTNYN